MYLLGFRKPGPAHVRLKATSLPFFSPPPRINLGCTRRGLTNQGISSTRAARLEHIHPRLERVAHIPIKPRSHRYPFTNPVHQRHHLRLRKHRPWPSSKTLKQEIGVQGITRSFGTRVPDNEARASQHRRYCKASMTPPVALTGIEASKRLAAYKAVDNHVKPEHQIIGIGSGSTVPYVVERIVQQGVEVNKSRVFVPTGFQSRELIVAAGLTLGDMDQHPVIDVTIDGADEVDENLNCIKGGGACHLREKVLAEAANTFIVVADFRKNVRSLGTNWQPGVPIEVVPFAYGKVLRALIPLGSPNAKLRMAIKKAGPVVSDNGNFVIDAPFDQEKYKNPSNILTQIKLLTGVVEVGLFCNIAQAAYFGNEDGSVTVRWNDGRIEQVAP